MNDSVGIENYKLYILPIYVLWQVINI